jgi:hypothetical protein
MRVRITWVAKGTNNAALLGLDETVEADSLGDARDAAIYHAECQGIELDRYDIEVEEIED